MFFKYTVANKEGKRLSGTVEAPDETTARTELNNLGFSILLLDKTDTPPILDENLKKFIFEAIDRNSKLITGSIPAQDKEDAFKKLSLEYSFIVTAVWQENSTEKEIATARKEGQAKMQTQLKTVEENLQKEKIKTLEQEKEEQILKAKIEFVLAQVNELLKEFGNDFETTQKEEINKKINKLLRIKNSTNVSYILQTAEDLLETIRNEEKTLKEKGLQDKRIDLEMKTKKLLDELRKSPKPSSLSEDIIEKINKWEDSHKQTPQTGNAPAKFIHKILAKIKSWFETPLEILVIKEQIKVYNKQIWEFIKLYFKEPSKEYKDKVKNSIKTIKKKKKKAIHSLEQAKKLLKERHKSISEESDFMMHFIEELNTFTGWLLACYVIYYLAAIYLTTKNFGLSNIPKAFYIYDTKLFKYMLAITFLLHATLAIKVNFIR
ncbi:hypothetical protein HZC20_00100, partial [Candidatus Peregrinibacteria bacterium]|nr:hypothetical protein [Candidatus Peregrinibacteria bacterium]